MHCGFYVSYCLFPHLVFGFGPISEVIMKKFKKKFLMASFFLGNPSMALMKQEKKCN